MSQAAGANGASAAAAAPRPSKAAKPAAAPGATSAKPFTNVNRFAVPRHAQQEFLAEWRRREVEMQQHPGFSGFNVISDGENYTISSR